VARLRLLPLADDLLDLLAYCLAVHAQGLERLAGDALAFMKEAEQDVLGADVVVVENSGLFLSQDHNPPCPVGKPLEHLSPPPSQCAPARVRRKPGGQAASMFPVGAAQRPQARSPHLA